MAVKIGDVTIRIGASTKQLEADLRKAERSLQATADKFTNIGQNLTLGVTAPVLAAGAAAFKMASDYEESLNKVRVAFGGSSESVEQFAKTAIDSIGLAEQSALDMAALFGDMATSMGLTQPAAAQMSTSLVQLAGDLASFKNINIEEATTALAGVFTGETESLKRLGVVMTEANVQAYALEKGIKKKLNTMSQAEKVSLRYQYVLDKTKNAQGDFARTSDGAANQMRTLQQSVKDLGADFGKELLPIITPLIQKLVQAVKTFANFDDATKKTIITVAGLAATLGPLAYVVSGLVSSYSALITPIVRLAAALATKTTATTASAAAESAAAASTITFGTAVRATLITIAPYVAAIGLIAAGIYALYQSYKDANNQIDKNAELTKKASDAIASEQAQTQSLIAVIRDENKSKKEKEGALRKLQDIAPEYFKNLSIEKSSIKDINAAYASYNASIERSIKAKIGKEDLESQIKDERRLVQSIKDRQKSIEELSKKTPKTATGSIREGGGAEQISQINKLKDLYSDQSAELKQLESTKKLKDETLKFINANEDLISSVDSGSKSVGEISTKTDEYTKKIQQLNIDLQNNQKLLQAGLISSPEAAVNELDILQKKLETLILSGLNPTSDTVQEVKNNISQLKSIGQIQLLPPTETDATFGKAIDILQTNILKGATTAGDATAKILEKTKGQVAQYFVGLEKGFINSAGKFTQYSAEVAETTVNVGKFASEALTASFELLGTTLGQALTGDASFANFLDGILVILADFASIFGKELIAIGVAKQALDELFKFPGGGIVAIAAGVALIAAAGALKRGLSKKMPSLAIGTDLVKSDGLAMIHKGEAIVPANVAKGGYTGGGQNINVNGRIQGYDLILVSDYAATLKNRIR